MIPRKNLARLIKKSWQQPGYAIHNLGHRLRSSMSYHFSNGHSYWPETISLFLTYHCNLRCKMCGQWGEQGIFKTYAKKIINSRLSKDEIKALIRDVAFFKPNITLFGGEPMLYPGWLEVVSMIKQAGLRCNMITNGTLVKRYAEQIVDSELDEIIFSLDGPENIHDEIRGVPGIYQKTMAGFDRINQYKQAQGKKLPYINVNSTITPQNYRHFDEIITAAGQIGTRGLTFHHLLFLDPTGVDDFIRFFQTKFGQSPIDWRGFSSDDLPKIDSKYLIQKIRSLSRTDFPFEVTFFPNFSDQEICRWYSQFPFQASSYKNRCQSLWMTAYIFPEGTLRPYHTMNYDMGNIKNNKFTNIWNNSKYVKYRSYIKRNKQFPVCSKGCTEFYRY